MIKWKGKGVRSVYALVVGTLGEKRTLGGGGGKGEGGINKRENMLYSVFSWDSGRLLVDDRLFGDDPRTATPCIGRTGKVGNVGRFTAEGQPHASTVPRRAVARVESDKSYNQHVTM